jgi:hypothetical protein
MSQVTNRPIRRRLGLRKSPFRLDTPPLYRHGGKRGAQPPSAAGGAPVVGVESKTVK